MHLRHLLLLGVLATGSGSAQTCRLCGGPAPPAAPSGETARPLRIEITAGLDFSRAAAAGGGGEIDVAANGSRRVAGGLVDLGGIAFAGSALVTGEPGRAVRIDVPSRIELTDALGGHADVRDIRTDLSPAPRLDAAGQLRFSFGGRLVVAGGSGGSFRGNIPITADYE